MDHKEHRGLLICEVPPYLMGCCEDYPGPQLFRRECPAPNIGWLLTKVTIPLSGLQELMPHVRPQDVGSS